MKPVIAILLLSAATAALAQTPNQTAGAYAAQARQADAAFVPSASRGAALFAKRFGVSAKLESCAVCHTEDPAQPGRHAVTGKTIKPMAVRANAERFTDPAKTEKWFRRNCTEVVGRECTAAEKADVLRFLIGGV